MTFKTGDIINGFKLLEIKEIKELRSNSLLFEHVNTGARLLKLENDDDNKVFSIAFRTPPYDDTGLPHILEHSVLCGSRKFPSKEPFVELIKGSLNTFLNAMTFSDKTMYPIASKNKKDFFNLMDVYLDAVLYPNIHSDEKIMQQEGWHYELDDKDGEIIIKGVVYNEMKGAFSNPVRKLYSDMESALYPDTAYAHESGGDPEAIPELTLEEFRAFHKKYYHPTNSYIYLYGDGNTEEELKFIQENYLKDFNKIDIDSRIEFQKPFETPKNINAVYGISADDDKTDKSFLSMGFTAGNSSDVEFVQAFEILKHMLLDTPAAPLKKALIKSGICKDVMGIADTNILQPFMAIIAKYTDESKKDEFENIIFNTLKELSEKGIDPELVESSVNIHEFRLREAEFGYPKGLVYNIMALTTWLYDESPVLQLNFEPAIEKIRNEMTNGYFERFIKENLLTNNHRVLVVLKPYPGLLTEKEREMNEKLKSFKEGLSDSELQEIIDITQALKKKQQTPDSPEVLETIPMLAKEDISRNAEKYPIKKLEDIKGEFYFSDLFTNGISYLNLLFDTRHVEQALLEYIPLVCNLLGKISTRKNNYGSLSNAINKNTGGIIFKVKNYVDNKGNDVYNPYIMAKGKSLSHMSSSMVRLMTEIVVDSTFEDKDRILQVVREAKSRMEMNIMNNGHVFAKTRLFSYFSEAGAYDEITTGIHYYHFLKDIEEKIEKDFESVKNNLNKVVNDIFTLSNLKAGFTGDENDLNNTREGYEYLISALSEKECESEKCHTNKYSLIRKEKNEGLTISGQVQYVAMGNDFRRFGFDYTGQMEVMKTIVGLDYLWNQVRVLGGAYGAFIRLTRHGDFFLGSYRDPNLLKTVEAYKGIAKYLKGFKATEREMLKYIIGSISNLDRHKNPAEKGEDALENLIRGITDESTQKIREEVLSVKEDQIREFAVLFEKALEEEMVAVVGSEDKIKKENKVFDNTVKVI